MCVRDVVVPRDIDIDPGSYTEIVHIAIDSISIEHYDITDFPYFVYEVMKSAQLGAAYVHAGPESHRLKFLEYLDIVSGVTLLHFYSI